MGRRLCLISLLFIIFVAASVYGPWDYLGVYEKSDIVSAYLSDGARVSATGEITRKEIKNDKVVYYVDDATITCEDGAINSISFIFKFDSDSIPNNSKVNIDGNIGIFNEARNEGGFDMKAYYNSLGYYFELRDVTVLDYSTSLLCKSDFLYRLNRNILAVYKKVLPGEEAGLLASVAVGNRSDLEDELKSLFQLVGLAHILAVSGLHVSVVCMSLYRLLKRCGLGFLASGIIAGIIAALYCLLTGKSISSVRAIGMFLIYILADIVGESYDTLSALAFMADILILKNPLYLTNPSFIFSFGAILGIAFIALPLGRHYQGLSSHRKRLYRFDDGFSMGKKLPVHLIVFDKFKASLVFSFGIYFAMLPIVTNMYYETPIYSIFINLIALPVLPALLGLGLAGGFLGLLSISLARLFLMPCHIIIYSFELLASSFSGLANSSVIVGYHKILWLILYYVIILVIINYEDIRSWFRKESSAFFNPRKALKIAQRRLLISLAAIFTVGLLWLIPAKESFEVDILDVGQGDGIYISSGDGVKFFIDGGSTSSNSIGKYTLLPFLKYKGASHIDYWFLSHMDLDHVSGVMELLEEGYEIDNIVLSAQIPYDETLASLLALAKANQTEILYMNAGDVCGSKHLCFKCIYPFSDSSSDDINALSLCLLMEYDKNLDGELDYTGFFGGDIGAEQEAIIAAAHVINHVDLLKVSHHGSRYSSDAGFLSTLSPDVAVISCSSTNRYGHPADEAVERLDKYCSRVYYTMRSGRIRCRPDYTDGYL